MPIFPRNLIALSLITSAAALSVSRSHGDQQAATAPVPTEPSSLLQQLSDETENAYTKARRGTVVIQLPTRYVDRIRFEQEAAQLKMQQDFIDQWSKQMTPEVLKAYKAQQAKALEQFRKEREGAATRPSTEDEEAQRHVLYFGKGLLLDHAGNVLINEYIDPADMPNPVPAQTGDGRGTSVSFVGSDPISRLTVVKLRDPSGDPVTISRGRPHEGALVLAVNPGGGVRLVVWTANHPEPGLIVLPDGSVSCFSPPDGRFMAIATARPVADQLIATGKVRRALLGVGVEEVRKDDPARTQMLTLGQLPALRVLTIKPDSAAERGKLKPGDLILAVDSLPVGDAATFAAVISARNGSTPLTVIRDSETVELSVDMKPAN